MFGVLITKRTGNYLRRCKEDITMYTKMIANMDGLSYEDRLRCLNLLSLEEFIVS